MDMVSVSDRVRVMFSVSSTVSVMIILRVSGRVRVKVSGIN